MSNWQAEQDLKNQKSLLSPRVGDYWHEMFCPYFIVVDINNDKYTVLSCMGGPHSFNRKDEPNARKELDNNSWCFDYAKSMVVDQAWIERAVRYETIDGFVADVVNSEKTERIVQEWRKFHAQSLREKISELESQWEQFTGWKYIKEGIPS